MTAQQQQEERIQKFLKDRGKLNKELEKGLITPLEYAERHRQMRQRLVDDPLSLTKVVEGIRYNSDRLQTSLLYAIREKDTDAQLGRLAETLDSSILDLQRLLEDIKILRQFEHPHILLRLEMHPCMGCLGFNQLEPDETHECCEECPDFDARRAWEVEKQHYNDIIEVG